MKDYVLAASSVFRGEVVLEQPKDGFNRKVSEDEAAVCLTCTKKKCTGDPRCFRQRRDRLRREGSD